VPHNAAVGFQSTSTLLKYNLLSIQKEAEADLAVSRKSKGSTSMSRTTKRAQEDTAETAPKVKSKAVKESGEKTRKPRKRKSDEVDGQSTSKPRAPKAGKAARAATSDVQKGVANSVDKPAPKPRKRRKTDDSVQAVMGQTEENSAGAKSGKKTARCSTHFAQLADMEFAANAAQVQPAKTVQRRTIWTPPKPSATPENNFQEIDIYNISSSPPAIMISNPKPLKLNFSELQKTYGYEDRDLEPASPPREVPIEKATRLAKQIDVIPDLRPKSRTTEEQRLRPDGASATTLVQQEPAVNVLRSKSKDKKKASPKKGPGGITGRSIARYAVAEVSISAETEMPNVSPHFAPIFEKPAEVAASKVTKEATVATKPAKARKPRAKKGDVEKEPKKKKKAVAKVKVLPPPAPKLASPKQHDAKLKKQNVMFGTSSQLVQDISPQTLRVLQESCYGPDLATLDEDASTAPITLRFGDAARRSRRNLWNESLHANADQRFPDISDFDGPLPRSPMENGVEESSLVGAVTAADAFAPVNDESIVSDVDHESAPVPSNGFWLTTRNGNIRKGKNMAPIFSSTAITLSSCSPPSSPRTALRALSTNTKSPTKTQAPEKPAEERSGADTPSHSKLIQIGDKPKNVATAKTGPQTPRKRGRPRTIPVAAASPAKVLDECDVDDIEDSEPDHTPSPRRKPNSPSASQTLPLTSIDEHGVVVRRKNTLIVNASHPRWPTIKAKLFPEITAVVKGARPTGSIKSPSWYEKMLLYDPIVLEDLTCWLNGQGLRIEGKDQELVEISPWMTQAWCEMNSICCLWKEGLRGGVKVRY